MDNNPRNTNRSQMTDFEKKLIRDIAAFGEPAPKRQLPSANLSIIRVRFSVRHLDGQTPYGPIFNFVYIEKRTLSLLQAEVNARAAIRLAGLAAWTLLEIEQESNFQ